LDGGRVLHLSTGLAHHPLAGMSTYCLSKSALFMLYECLRLELKNRDIAFGSINPGPVDTAMQDKIRHSKSTALPEVKRFIDMKDQGQLLPPTVVADFMSWLLFEVDKEKFSQNEWDIRDSSHHHFWLKDKNIIWGARI
jgi:NAD(P)-dependent dehydrogenase (short-subunit alcohol dehydrogenase family)